MDIKEIKVVFLGCVGVGKTNLIQRFINNNYQENQPTSYTVTYHPKIIKYEGKEYNFIIWDTPGAELHRASTKLFLKDVEIFVLVYDITQKKTFLELQYWLDYILEEYQSKSFIILIGNKKDLINKEINEKDGLKFAEIIKAKFAQVSAKDNDNWTQIFEDILKDYLRSTKQKEKDDHYLIDEDDSLIDEILY